MTHRGQRIYSLEVPGLYEIYANAISELPHGEYLQIKARKTIEGMSTGSPGPFPLLFEEYLEKSHYKTGSLFTNLLLGTALICQGRFHQPTFERVRALGMNLGLSFQIADDLKDIRPDSQELAKDALNDLRERNTTAPYLLALKELSDRGEASSVESVMSVLQKKEKTEEDIALVFKICKQSRAEEETRNMIEYHFKEAQQAFNSLCSWEEQNRLLVVYSQPFLKI